MEKIGRSLYLISRNGCQAQAKKAQKFGLENLEPDGVKVKYPGLKSHPQHDLLPR